MGHHPWGLKAPRTVPHLAGIQISGVDGSGVDLFSLQKSHCKKRMYKGPWSLSIRVIRCSSILF